MTTTRRRASIVLPLFLVGVVAAVAAFLLLGDESAEPDDREPVSIDADGPVFDSADEMAAASDLVVDATVVSVRPGRVVTAPDDPNRGIRTRLVELDVESTLVGDAPDTLIVEQEDTLLDGTPITVNGVVPSLVGERAIWFLVADPTGDSEFFAVVNDQGRVPVP